MGKITNRDIPVRVNDHHFMGKATVLREPNKVMVTLFVEGESSQILGELLEQPEAIGATFGPLPVLNIREKKERN